MRTLFARNHATVYPGKGFFLAGPTPPNGEMVQGWRRTLIDKLETKHELDDDVIIVAPEPVRGEWDSILSSAAGKYAKAENDQIAWELQYLGLCDVTAFWLPVYWEADTAGNFPANIGPTTRWEFGLLLQKYLDAPHRRKLILGGPDDAQSVGWARHMARHYNIPWHSLPVAEKGRQVSDSFIGDAVKG